MGYWDDLVGAVTQRGSGKSAAEEIAEIEAQGVTVLTERPDSAAQPGAPPGTAGGAPLPEAVGSATSGSMVTFNDQLYLMDMYAAGIIGPQGNKVHSAQVPSNFPSTVLNNFLQVETNAQMTWLQKLTPAEYAQLVPAVQLSVVNLVSQESFDIPLNGASNIDGVASQEYWYTNRTVGLKSFDMKLDGNTNPVGGKIYNISLTLLFDSANTFFGSIPGSPLKYSQVFRSQGPAGSASHNFKLKLTVYYDGPAALVSKYNLHANGMAYSSYLDLVYTDLQIDETLKTTVKTKFIGFEESLFNNGGLYDWLKIDLSKAREIIDNERIALTGQKTAALENARENLGNDRRTNVTSQAEGVRAAIAGNLQGYKAQHNTLMAQIAKDNAVIDQMSENGTRVPLDPDLRRQYEQAQTRRDKARRQAARMNLEVQNGLAGSGMAYTSPTDANGQPLSLADAGTWSPQQWAAYQTDNSFLNQQMVNQIAEQATNIATNTDPNQNLADTFGGDITGALMSEAAALEAKNHAHEAAAEASLNTINAEFEGRVDQLQVKLQSMRMKLISDALQATFFNPPGSSQSGEKFFHLDVTSIEVQRYLDNMLIQDIKDFPGGPPTITSSRSVTFPGPSSGASGTSGANAALDHANANISSIITRRNRAQTMATQGRERAASLRRQAAFQRSQPGGGNSLTRANALDAQATAILEGDTIKNAESKIRNMNDEIAKAQSERTLINEQTAELGSKADLEKQLNQFQRLEYIYLGDLMSLIIKRLESLQASELQKRALRKTLFVITKMNVQGGAPGFRWNEKSMYKFPISIMQLQKLLADKLYGTMRTSYTIFEFFNDMSKLIALTQQRKAKMLSSSDMSNNLSIKFIPLALVGSSGYKIASSFRNDEPNIRHAIIAVPKTGQTLGRDEASNLAGKVPHVYVGGQAYGCVKSIKMTEIADDSMRKVAFENNQRGGAQIPAFFKVELTLVGTPFFHLGTFFMLDPVSLDTSSSNWVFLKGHYSVIELTHAYTTGGGYETIVTGFLQNNNSAKQGVQTALQGGMLEGII